MPELAASRKQRLRTLEKEIREGMEEFYYTGMKLKEIRDDELYEEDGFTTWEGYIKARWDWKIRYVQLVIKASEYRQVLPSPSATRTSSAPEWSEASVRELTRIEDKREAARVAKKVIAEVEKEEGAKLTSTFVRKVVDEELGVKRGKPRPEPEPEEESEGNLHEYLQRYADSIDGWRESLESIPQDAWTLLNRKRPTLVKRLITAADRLAGFLRKVE